MTDTVESNLIAELAGEGTTSLFADEMSEVEEVDTEEEETVDDEQELDSEEDDDSEEDTEEESDEEEEQDSELSLKYDNVKRALHAEREKRKEMSAQAQSLYSQLEYASTEASDTRAAFDQIVEALRENGLEDLIDIPRIEKMSPEVLEARKLKQMQEQEQNVQAFYEDVKKEAMSLAPSFENINLSDDYQGTILTQLITSAAINGLGREDAVTESMRILDSLVGSIKKEVLKKRQPPVKPKAKPRARTKQSKGSSTMRQNIEKGNFDDVFAAIANRAVGGGD